METRLPIGGESESFFDALKDGVVIWYVLMRIVVVKEKESYYSGAMLTMPYNRISPSP